MKAPAITDQVVRVRAYMTDEQFGYDYWAARQFCSPAGAKPAVLVIFDDEAARDALLARVDELRRSK